MIPEGFTLQNSEKCRPYPQDQELKDFLTQQFGFYPDLLAAYYFYDSLENNILFLSNQPEIPRTTNITQIGLPAYKGIYPRGYVTNAFIYRFGKHAVRNVIDINTSLLPALLNREGLPLEKKIDHSGHQIIRSGKYILGRGWLRDGNLYMDAPKIWKQNLL